MSDEIKSCGRGTMLKPGKNYRQRRHAQCRVRIIIRHRLRVAICQKKKGDKSKKSFVRHLTT